MPRERLIDLFTQRISGIRDALVGKKTPSFDDVFRSQVREDTSEALDEIMHCVISAYQVLEEPMSIHEIDIMLEQIRTNQFVEELQARIYPSLLQYIYHSNLDDRETDETLLYITSIPLPEDYIHTGLHRATFDSTRFQPILQRLTTLILQEQSSPGQLMHNLAFIHFLAGAILQKEYDLGKKHGILQVETSPDIKEVLADIIALEIEAWSSRATDKDGSEWALSLRQLLNLYNMY